MTSDTVQSNAESDKAASVRVSQRAPRSCALCYKLKTKCSKTFPCTQCIKRGKADTCAREKVLVKGTIIGGLEETHRREMTREELQVENRALIKKLDSLEKQLNLPNKRRKTTDTSDIQEDIHSGGASPGHAPPTTEGPKPRRRHPASFTTHNSGSAQYSPPLGFPGDSPPRAAMPFLENADEARFYTSDLAALGLTVDADTDPDEILLQEKLAWKGPLRATQRATMAALLDLVPVQISSLLVRAALKFLGHIFCTIDVTAYVAEHDAWIARFIAGDRRIASASLALYFSLISSAMYYLGKNVLAKTVPFSDDVKDQMARIWFEACLAALDLSDYGARAAANMSNDFVVLQTITVLPLIAHVFGASNHMVFLLHAGMHIMQRNGIHALGTEPITPMGQEAESLTRVGPLFPPPVQEQKESDATAAKSNDARESQDQIRSNATHHALNALSTLQAAENLASLATMSAAPQSASTSRHENVSREAQSSLDAGCRARGPPLKSRQEGPRKAHHMVYHGVPMHAAEGWRLRELARRIWACLFIGEAFSPFSYQPGMVFHTLPTLITPLNMDDLDEAGKPLRTLHVKPPTHFAYTTTLTYFCHIGNIFRSYRMKYDQATTVEAQYALARDADARLQASSSVWPCIPYDESEDCSDEYLQSVPFDITNDAGGLEPFDYAPLARATFHILRTGFLRIVLYRRFVPLSYRDAHYREARHACLNAALELVKLHTRPLCAIITRTWHANLHRVLAGVVLATEYCYGDGSDYPQELLRTNLQAVVDGLEQHGGPTKIVRQGVRLLVNILREGQQRREAWEREDGAEQGYYRGAQPQDTDSEPRAGRDPGDDATESNKPDQQTELNHAATEAEITTNTGASMIPTLPDYSKNPTDSKPQKTRDEESATNMGRTYETTPNIHPTGPEISDNFFAQSTLEDAAFHSATNGLESMAHPLESQQQLPLETDVFQLPTLDELWGSSSVFFGSDPNFNNLADPFSFDPNAFPFTADFTSE